MKAEVYFVTLVIAIGYHGKQIQAQSYAMDRQSTCNQYITVYETELTLTARSNVAPANPPLECIVYLQSAFELADGRYRLQIIIEQLQIDDCGVRMSIFNGYGATGNYLRELGCSSSSTDIIYTTGRQATVRFTRPQYLYQTAYAVTLTIKTYADGNDLGTAVGVEKLATGAIIGIAVGALVVIAVAILLCWCCRTGYLYQFMGIRGWGNGHRDNVKEKPTGGQGAYLEGSLDSNLEKLSTTSSTMQLKNGINTGDAAIWSSLTGLNDKNRYFQKGVPRRASGRATNNTSRETDSEADIRPRTQQYENTGRKSEARDSHSYEPYDMELADADRSPLFRRRQNDQQGGSNRSRGSRSSRRSRNSGTEADPTVQTGGKETVIDDPGTTDDESLETKKSREEDVDVVNLQRFESEPDVDTIASPMHVNAGVRASIPDLTEGKQSPAPSPRAKKRSSTSPKSRRRPKGPGGHEPDPMGLPPEAFDPVFTTPTSQEQYPGEFRPAMPSMPFVPYGMFPMVPGQQTYAYAYQTAPQTGAYPGNQGAYFMQSVPTADGNVQNTAFVMQSTRTPKRDSGRGKGGRGAGPGHPGAPDFTSTPDRGHRGPDSPPSDMSLIAAGAAPPDPGQGHRSVAMKSFADPDTGIQTTQVVWTDNVPDVSDPKPEDSCQVTRKNITRVTTRSGHGELPTQTTTLLDYQDPNPAFLAPSAATQQPLYHPASATPNTSNVDYYLGQGQRSAPVRGPDVVHEAPSRSRAIRDRINLGESTA